MKPPPPQKKKQPSQQKNALVQGSTLTSPPKKQGNLQVYLKQILKKWSKIEKILVNVTSVAHLDENLYSERNGSIWKASIPKLNDISTLLTRHQSSCQTSMPFTHRQPENSGSFPWPNILQLCRSIWLMIPTAANIQNTWETWNSKGTSAQKKKQKKHPWKTTRNPQKDVIFAHTATQKPQV